jgi:hypothetical protein
MVYTLLCFVMWLFTGKVLRFLIPLVPLLCMLSAEGIIQAIGVSMPLPFKDKVRIFFKQPPVAARVKFPSADNTSHHVINSENAFRGSITNEFASKLALYPVLALVLLHNILFFHWVMASPDPYSPVICGVGRNEYLSAKLNYFGALNEYVNKLPSAKVLFIGETRGYYCKKPALVPTYFDTNPVFAWANTAADDKAFLNTIQNEHITHLLFNQAEYSRLGFAKYFTQQGQTVFEQFLRDYTSLEYADKNTRVYKINPPAGPAS